MTSLSSALTRLKSQECLKEPVEGFMVELAEDADLFRWHVWIEGPSDTLFAGGIFRLSLVFPDDYPMNAPELTFLSDFWHPNVYAGTGIVCISILHAPGEDETSGEHASERWLPTRTVSSIILSVISLLSAPNFSSPANVDASIEWRDTPEVYAARIAKLVLKSVAEKPDRVVIPHPDTDAAQRSAQAQRIRFELTQFDESELAAAGADSTADDEEALDFLVPSDESFHESEIEDNETHSDDPTKQSRSRSQSQVSHNGIPARRSKKKKHAAVESYARKANTEGSDKRKKRHAKKCSVM